MSKDDALVVFTPSGRRGRFPLGTPVLTAARKLGVDLDSVCGGRGICSRCQITPSYGEFSKHGVTVAEGALSEWNAVEERYKQKRGLIDGRRLGCQAKVEGDVVIDVPPESQVHKQIVRKEADNREIVLDPATRLYFVEVEEPDMHNPSSDTQRLLAALEQQWGLDGVICDLRTMQMLQGVLRAGKWSVTCAVHTNSGSGGRRVISVWPGFFDGTIYGAAFDVGSTTIACHLCDLRTGRVVASAGLMNPQIRFGEDLMSRVSYSMMNPGGSDEMTRAVREAINALIGQVCAEAVIGIDEVLEAVFVGNPIMHHLLLGIDPVELGGAPFALAVGGGLNFWAKELEINMHPDARIYILPCIAGHVGADAAAVALAEAVHESDDLHLVVDVGTNAEILLGNRARQLACSSPTGPAFEGAQISSGQRAARGAIERIRIDPDTKEPRFKVIGCDLWSDDPGFDEAVGEGGVTGIAGSGIIEAIAEMRLADVIDEDGVVRGDLASGSNRVFSEGRTFGYLVHQDATRRITVTQNDVRAIQLAKAALYAGCRLLMDELGVETVDRITLAGAFGAHISPVHAMALGMIPDCEVENVRSAGNAAGTGARIALLNIAKRREVEQIVRGIEKIETAVEPKFQEHFIEAMAVPHKTAPYPLLKKQVTFPVSHSAAPTDDGRGRRRRRARV